MKTGCAVVFMLMLGAGTLAAQSASQQKGPTILFNDSARAGAGQQSNTVVIIPLSKLGECPVTMRAQHLPDGNLLKSGSGHPKGMGQWLHLTFTSPETKQIASALLTVRGATPKGRVMKAEQGQGGDANATQSLTVSFSAGPDRTATADLWVPGMTAVETIELRSVEYSDGSNWKLAGSTTCQVKPDPLMLITSR